MRTLAVRYTIMSQPMAKQAKLLLDVPQIFANKRCHEELTSSQIANLWEQHFEGTASRGIRTSLRSY